jgi:hypothetical protein
MGAKINKIVAEALQGEGWGLPWLGTSAWGDGSIKFKVLS